MGVIFSLKNLLLMNYSIFQVLQVSLKFSFELNLYVTKLQVLDLMTFLKQ